MDGRWEDDVPQELAPEGEQQALQPPAGRSEVGCHTPGEVGRSAELIEDIDEPQRLSGRILFPELGVTHFADAPVHGSGGPALRAIHRNDAGHQARDSDLRCAHACHGSETRFRRGDAGRNGR